MAYNFSTYLQNKLIGVTLLGSSFTAPTTVWVSLATSLNSDGDSYTEVTTNLAYARKVVTFPTPSAGSTSNSPAITFSAATSPWGVVKHWALFDSGTIGAGNMLYWGDVDYQRDVRTSDTYAIPVSQLTVTLA